MNLSHNRYQHIDAIRGIAALLVVWMHVSEMFRSFLMEKLPDYWLYTAAETLDFGRIGVVAFFAVSGFVIPSSFSGQGWSGFKTFAIKRFFRIYPAFWLSIPLAIWSGWFLWNKDVTSIQIASNISMLPQFFGQTPLEGLYWTLQLELLFYGLCSCLFIFGRLNTHAVALATLAFFIAFSEYRNNLNLLYLSIMFWGALYRSWYEKTDWKLYHYLPLIGVSSAIIIGFSYQGFLKLYHLNHIEPVWIKFIASHVLGLLLFIGLTTLLKLKQRPFVFLGEISYSIYLFHPVVFYPIYWWAGRTEHAWVREMPLAFWIISIILTTIAFSYLIYRFVEKPSIRLGKKLSQAKTENTTSEIA